MPVVLHEQNAIAGLTNHWLSKIATRVLQAFPNAFPDAEVVGNPVRRDLFQTATPEVRFAERDKTLRILVVGGSQGARVLNQTVPQVAAKLTAQGYDIHVRHQVGKGNLAGIEEIYRANGNGVATEFIDDMAEAYAWADLVICRSGALTVCELAAVGTPAIFVPFQHKDRQQFLNAKYLADAGAALIIEQPEFTEERLLQTLTPLLAEREKLLNHGIKCKKNGNTTISQTGCRCDRRRSELNEKCGRFFKCFLTAE